MATADASESPNNIFHAGSLQSGIQRAIAENKVVAVFLHTPDDHTSSIWQDYWLSNNSQPTDMISSDAPPLGLVIAEKAVLLKIEAGSREAGFLKAFVNVESVPSMVIIRNGRVLENIGHDTSKEEFTTRLLKAVGFEGAEGMGRREPEGPPEGLNDEEEIVDDIGGRHAVTEGGTNTEPATNVATSEVPQQGTQAQPSHNAQTLLAERARRLESERVQREAHEKAERTARVNARRREEEEAAAAGAAASQSQPSRDKGKQRAVSEEKQKQQARDAWIYQQKQRKDEAKKERERILAQIESDKQERKAAAQRRKDLETSAGGGAFSENSASLDQTTTQPSSRSIPSTPTTCALQIRLFDGSSIRGKFSSDSDIATAVRTWVKEASPDGGADIPFNFRLIQPPKPSRTIEVSEEHQSLLELGLAPSATLVLVPVAGATSAYAGSNQGYLGTAYNAASWAMGGAFSLLGTAWSYVPGFGGGAAGSGPYIGGTGDEQERSNAEGARMAGSDTVAPGGRVMGLVDGQRKKDDDVATFYNGNSSAFEGRKDDDGT